MDHVGGRGFDDFTRMWLLSPAVRGKSMIVTRRLAAHDRLRDAAYHWARVAAPRDPASHDKYQSFRARGHDHARALRSVADRLLSVACAMLHARARFERHLEGGQANHRTGDRPSRPSAAPCRQCRSSSRSSRRLAPGCAVVACRGPSR